VRYDWKAGDIAIVHNNCVHQHFNASAKEPARALVIKTKPMYLFMNMLFQHTVQQRPKTPSPTQGNFVPRQEEEDYNHPGEKAEQESGNQICNRDDVTRTTMAWDASKGGALRRHGGALYRPARRSDRHAAPQCAAQKGRAP
jgi:hypothetical protein